MQIVHVGEYTDSDNALLCAVFVCKIHYSVYFQFTPLCL